MKSVPIFSLALAGILCGSLFEAHVANGATVAYSFDNIDQPIPDGSPLGWSDGRTITASFAVIQSVTVSVNITGGFNGDVYALLTHSTGFSVLLNRVGRTASNLSGYADSGLDIQFNDGAPAAGDVHQYRTILGGNETTPIAGALTGIWQPDGRTTDPGSVLNTDARTALLSSFNGLDPNGEWTLFIADLDSGGQGTVHSWGLTIQGQSVPEPDVGGLLLFSLLMWSWLGRSRPRGSIHARSSRLNSAGAVNCEIT